MSSVAQIGVVRELGKGERAVPCADFAVEDGAGPCWCGLVTKCSASALPTSCGERPAGQLLK